MESIENKKVNNSGEIISAGHTFFSFIADNSLIVAGDIKDYLSNLIAKTNTRSIFDSEKYETTGNIKENIHCLKFKNNKLSPTYLSCNKNSLAMILELNQLQIVSEVNENLKLAEENVKKLCEKIRERLTVIKEDFQQYFLSDIPNYILNETDETGSIFEDTKTYHIRYDDFSKKVNSLFEGVKKNDMKEIIKNGMEEMKNLSWISQEKVNILKFFKVMMNLEADEDVKATRIFLIGEFAKYYFDENKGGEHLNSKRFNQTYGILEFPQMMVPIKAVEIGESHMLMLSKDGNVYACGEGKNGLTGDDNREFHSKPMRVKFPENTWITKISVGNRHNLAISDSKSLFSWGVGANGRLGHNSSNDVFFPKNVTSISSFKIEKVKAGDTYSAAISEEGILFTWGQGEFGRLGHQTYEDVLLPKKVEFFLENKKIVDTVECGYFTTLVKCYDNNQQLEIYSLGMKSTNLFINDKGKEKSASDPFLDDISGYDRIKLIKGDKVSPFLAVVGYQFIATITKPKLSSESGSAIEAYISGNMKMTINKNGDKFSLMKFENKEANKIFSKLLENENSNNNKKNEDTNGAIKSVVVSEKNTAIILNEGELFVFGSYFSQLCSEEEEKYIKPVLPKSISGTFKVTDVALGSDHILMVTREYQVYGAGINSAGQLGLGKPTDMIPMEQAKLITKLENKGIKNCYACENYSLALSLDYEIYIFGEVSFLSKSEFVNNQYSPNIMSWGMVKKVALGPCHILLLVFEDNKYVLRSLGNGTYYKLGCEYKEEKESNKYDPVDVHSPEMYADFGKCEKKEDSSFRLMCSRYNSGICIKIKDNDKDKNYKLYLWGLLKSEIFNDLKLPNEWIENCNEKPGKYLFKKPHVYNKHNNVKDFSLSDEGLCVLTQESELKSHGRFFSGQSDSTIIATGHVFDRVFLGQDHAIGINKDEIYAWGYNTLDILGFPQKEKDLIEKNTSKDFDLTDVFEKNPVKLEKINNYIEHQKPNSNQTATNNYKNPSTAAAPAYEENEINDKADDIDVSENDTPNNSASTKESNKINLTPEIMEQKTPVDNDVVYNRLIPIIDDYKNLEMELINTEINLKYKLKEILEETSYLVKEKQVVEALRQTLFTAFNFKAVDKPLNIETKRESRKIPQGFRKFEQNYICLLSMLKIHPCYIAKLYELKVIDDHSLLKIIKSLFADIYEDEYSQYLLIKLAVLILEKDLDKLLKDGETKESALKKIVLYRRKANKNSFELQYSLFSEICVFLLKSQLKFMKISQFMALFTIDKVYTKYGAKSSDKMKMAYKTRDGSEDDNSNRNNYLEPVIEIIEYFLDNFESAIHPNSSTLYNLPSGNESGEHKRLVYLNKNEGEFNVSYNMIWEIYKFLEQAKKYNVSEIKEFFYKKFPLIIFENYLEVIENPEKKLALNVGSSLDKVGYKSFLDKFSDGFYSIWYVFMSALYIRSSDENAEADDDALIKKYLKKKRLEKDASAILEDCIKTQVFPDFEERNSENFDMKLFKLFFDNSKNYVWKVVNFSYNDLKHLQQQIVKNIDTVRVLSKPLDLYDVVFMNASKERECIGERGGVCEDDLGGDLLIQVELNTRLLASKTPSTIVKCKECQVPLINELCVGFENSFFDEFVFFAQSSIENYLIKIMSVLSEKKKYLPNDKICEFLLKNFKDIPDLEEPLYNLLVLIEFKNPDDYQLEAEEKKFANKLILINIILEREKKTGEILKKTANDVLSKYEDMHKQKEKYEELSKDLDKIKLGIKSGETNEKRKLYESIKENFDKGYGNPDLINNYINFLKESKMNQLFKYSNDKPKSKNLMAKLTGEKKKQLLPFREFELLKLLRDKTIIKVHTTELDEVYSDINAKAAEYKLSIQKTKQNDFEMNLIKKILQKRSFFSCMNREEPKTKKIKTIKITNDIMESIILASNIRELYVIEKTFEVDSVEFIKKLKEIADIGIE